MWIGARRSHCINTGSLFTNTVLQTVFNKQYVQGLNVQERSVHERCLCERSLCDVVAVLVICSRPRERQPGYEYSPIIEESNQ